MTKYGKVENGEVVKMSSKPTSKRTSNLWLNDEAMKEEGWLPIDDKKPDTKPWQKKGARSEEVLKTKINFSYTVEDIPLEQFKEDKLQELLRNRDNTLLSRHGQMTLTLGALGVLSSAEKKSVDDDVKLVYDEVKLKEKAIQDCTTYQEVVDIYTGIIAFMDPSKVDENGWPIPEDIDLV